MKNFEITVSLKDNELLIIEEHTTGVKSFVENKEAVLRCIKNYIEIYVKNEKGERSYIRRKELYIKKTKDFEITVSLKGNELTLSEEHTGSMKGFIENEEDVARCIKNFIEIYVEKGEKK